MKKSKNKVEKKLTLYDAVGMAIGGMVGGGIFAVLGEAVHRSGNAAFLSFGLAGLLALITGISYSRLTLSFDEPGGSFLFVEKIAGARISGTVGWFLILGYIFTMSLYSYTFGVYAGKLFGVNPSLNGYLGGAIIAVFTGINLRGVRESGFTEDFLVYIKVAILLIVGGVGIFTVNQTEAFPIFEHSSFSIVTTAALIFVAYEGFQLLTYDYDDIADHKHNLPRAILISIPIVIVLYMFVSFVTTGTLSDTVIAQQKETVLAYVAQPILGKAGVLAVLVAAVFSTASAINATMFALARLADRIAKDGQFPSFFTRQHRGGIPIRFVFLASACTILIQFTGTLHEIVSFSSLVFLSVFSVVNLSALIHREYTTWKRIFPAAGFCGCIIAVVMLIFNLLGDDPVTLWIIGGITLVVIACRIIFTYAHPEFLQRHTT
jgi:hypothetical protein